MPVNFEIATRNSRKKTRRRRKRRRRLFPIRLPKF